MSLLKPQLHAELAVESFRFEDAPLVHLSGERVVEATQPSSHSPSPSEAKADGDELLERIDVLECSLSEAANEIERAKSESYEEGLRTGQEEADRLATEGLSLLREALEEGREELRKNFEHQLDAGIMIARAILRSVLGQSADLRDHIIQTAMRWKNELEDSSVISLRVSPLDFSDDHQLAPLEKSIAGTEIRIDPSLGRGACLFDLALGSLDASIPLQLENAEEFLNEFECRGDDK